MDMKMKTFLVIHGKPLLMSLHVVVLTLSFSSFKFRPCLPRLMSKADPEDQLDDFLFSYEDLSNERQLKA
jgi:hypothetical protein